MRVDFPSSTLPAVEKRSRSFSLLSLTNSSVSSALAKSSCGAAILEISLDLLEFHRAFLIMVNDAVFPLRTAEHHQLSNDFWDRIGIRGDCPGAMSAAQGTHTAHDHLRLLSRTQRRVVLYG